LATDLSPGGGKVIRKPVASFILARLSRYQGIWAEYDVMPIIVSIYLLQIGSVEETEGP
jgi:hypothetical protein